jgi:hypothetical protein
MPLDILKPQFSAREIAAACQGVTHKDVLNWWDRGFLRPMEEPSKKKWDRRRFCAMDAARIAIARGVNRLGMPLEVGFLTAWYMTFQLARDPDAWSSDDFRLSVARLDPEIPNMFVRLDLRTAKAKDLLGYDALDLGQPVHERSGDTITLHHNRGVGGLTVRIIAFGQIAFNAISQLQQQLERAEDADDD